MKDKKLIYAYIAIGLLLVAVLSFAYAYFSIIVNGEGNENVVTTGTLSIKYEDGPEVIANDIKPGDSITKTFTVENTGTLDTYYKIIWDDLINTFENDELVYTLKLGDNEDTGVVPLQSMDMKANIPIASKEIHEYTLIITFIETGAPQDYNQGKSFTTTLQILDSAESDLKLTLKVNGNVVESVPEDGYYKLAKYTCDNGSTIKWNSMTRKISMYASGVKESCIIELEDADTFGVALLRDNKILSDSSINFGEISSDTNGKGLYKTSDLTKTEDINGDGTGEEVLYFRGEVENNYVVFADFCWRIVRTNEDGSIKLRYGGTPDSTNGYCPQTGTEVKINNTNYAFNSIATSTKYIGYMYDTSTSSTAKNTIDTWYQNNIASKGENVTNIIEDTIYCNDTTVASTSGNYTYYGAYARLETNKTPQYKCPLASDAYSVSTDNGNGKLTYPIALLTADEVAYAGGTGAANTSYYLYTGTYYWTMSPYHFDGSTAREFSVHPTGIFVNYHVGNSNGLLPAVSLSTEAIAASGTGTYDNPYVITK